MDISAIEEFCNFIIKKEEFKRSDDYVLKDGRVYLMYPPYELDCYAVGTTYVELP